VRDIKSKFGGEKKEHSTRSTNSEPASLTLVRGKKGFKGSFQIKRFTNYRKSSPNEDADSK
jgi:hypothetical protein